MELQVNVNVRYGAQPIECIGDVLHHFESLAWVQLVLRQVLPQLRQISPTDPTALTKMVHDAEQSRSNAGISCAICMNQHPPTALGPAALELPCGHQFHCDCARSWLRRRSTCPLCRFQLPKAYSGTFAIKAVTSTLVLSSDHRHLPSSQILGTPTSGRTLQAVVKITMAQMSPDTVRRRRPCQVKVAVVHANGSLVNVPHDRTEKRQREGHGRNVVKRVRTTPSTMNCS